MLFSDWYKIRLNEITFVVFRGVISPISPPWIPPAPITYLLSYLCNCTVCTFQELTVSKDLYFLRHLQ